LKTNCVTSKGGHVHAKYDLSVNLEVRNHKILDAIVHDIQHDIVHDILNCMPLGILHDMLHTIAD